MLELTEFPLEAEAHIEVGTTLVHMPVGTMISLLASFSHKIGTDLEIVTEIALISITTSPHGLELVARFDFALVMRVRAVITEPTLTMYEFLTDSIGGEFVVVGRWRGRFLVGSSLVLNFEVSGVVGHLIGIRVHNLLY